MARIALSKGAFALVDDEDFEALSKFKWWLGTTGDARRTIWYGRRHIPNRRHVSMHRQILKVDNPEILVDHINGDRLDNRRSNLRLSDKSTNGCNTGKRRTNTSGYKGVTKLTTCDRWVAQIRVKGKNHYLGCFDDPKRAAAAYDTAAVLYFGPFARTNEV